MNRPLPKAKKPWSRKKRAITAVKMTAFILVIALFLGGGSYVWLRRMGMVSSQSIEQLVWKEIEDNPEILQAVQKSGKSDYCRNMKQGFEIRYERTLEAITKSGWDGCTQLLVHTPDGKKSRVVIQQLYLPKEKVIEGLLTNLNQVATNSIHHSFMDVTQIDGIKTGLNFSAWVLVKGEKPVWLVSFTPSDEYYKRQVLGLVKSFRVF